MTLQKLFIFVFTSIYLISCKSADSNFVFDPKNEISPALDINSAITFDCKVQKDIVKILEVKGGKPPYLYGIFGFRDLQKESEFGQLPNGKLRVYVQDSQGHRSFQKIVKIDRADYPTVNQINWDYLKPTKHTEGINAIFGWGTPVFKGEAYGSDALRYGFNVIENASTFSYEEIPGNKRCFGVYHLKINPDFHKYMNEGNESLENAGYTGISKLKIGDQISKDFLEVPQKTLDKFTEKFYSWATPYNNSWVFHDEENWPNEPQIARLNASLSRSLARKGVSTIAYGKMNMNIQLVSYSRIAGPTWKWAFFPFMPLWFRKNIFYLTDDVTNMDMSLPNQYIDFGGYLKTPHPEQNSKYIKKNGQYLLAKDGERLYRDDSFSERISNEKVDFLAQPYQGTRRVFKAPDSYGYKDNIVPELWFTELEAYSFLSRQIVGTVSLFKLQNQSLDQKNPRDLNVRPMAVIRDETEPFTFPYYSDQERALAFHQLEFNTLLALGLDESLYLWNTYGPMYQENITQKGSGKLTNFWDGPKLVNLAGDEAIAFTNNYVAQLHQTHGILSKDSRKLIFYEPANTHHEIAAFGTITGNKVWLVLAEPRLDCDEKMIVYLSNTKNDYVKKIELDGCSNFSDVFYLPENQKYNRKDIRLSYQDIYDVWHHVSGDLEHHKWTPK